MGTPIAESHADVALPDLLAALRREVGMLRRRETRQRFESAVHVGRLDGGRRGCLVPASALTVLDAGTRTEVITALLESAESGAPPPTSAWLTRAGEPVVQDDDLAWLSAATRAFGALGVPLQRFWTITRTGWLDVRTGDRRTWKRLRL